VASLFGYRFASVNLADTRVLDQALMAHRSALPRITRRNVVDLKLYVITRAYLNGRYDHIPASFFDAYPVLTGLVAAVDTHPSVVSYWATRAS
jgi:hypothetical protein